MAIALLLVVSVCGQKWVVQNTFRRADNNCPLVDLTQALSWREGVCVKFNSTHYNKRTCTSSEIKSTFCLNAACTDSCVDSRVFPAASCGTIISNGVFRGVVFNAWLREGGRRWAFIGSSLLFAAIHLSLASLLPIFALGLALAWVYDRTRNLLAPIAMHAVVNGVSVAFALLAPVDPTRLPV